MGAGIVRVFDVDIEVEVRAVHSLGDKGCCCSKKSAEELMVVEVGW